MTKSICDLNCVCSFSVWFMCFDVESEYKKVIQRIKSKIEQSNNNMCIASGIFKIKCSEWPLDKC